MIEAEVHIKSLEISRMVDWCCKNIGPEAVSRDTVDDDRPWHWNANFRKTTFYFARGRDATWFSLRWS